MGRKSAGGALYGDLLGSDILEIGYNTWGRKQVKCKLSWVRVTRSFNVLFSICVMIRFNKRFCNIDLEEECPNLIEERREIKSCIFEREIHFEKR